MKTVVTPVPEAGMGWSAVDEEEIAAVTALLRQPQNMFRYRDDGEPSETDRLEKAVCEKTGAAHSLFVASGTGALSCCLSAYQIGPGDEVIIPGYTFIATAAAVVDVGAVPVIAEIDDSLGMDPTDLEKKISPYTRAIILVHMVGVPARLDDIRTLCKKYSLVLIEDCCQAIGATYKGRYCGVDSDAFAWSTNFFKVITCGEGGVFATSDPAAFQRGVHQSDSGLNILDRTEPVDTSVRPFSRSGIRGNELAAAVLNVQLRKMDAMLSHTRALKKRLLTQLKPSKNYHLQHVDDPDGDCGFAVNFIFNSKEKMIAMLSLAEDDGLPMYQVYEEGDRHVFVHWDPIINKWGSTPLGYPWKDPAYKGSVEYSVNMCPNTLDILNRTARLLFNIKMTDANINEFAASINKLDQSI